MPSAPASRLGDMHVCPMVTGIVPHVGGPMTAPGAPMVLVGGLPAARVTDMAACVGPPDAVVAGAFTTLIGGLPAARINDPTTHGGTLLLGCFTVLIGDPVGVTVVRRGDMYIIVNALNHTIYLVGVQEYSGTGASQAYADSASASINGAWSGTTTLNGETYNTVAMVQGRYNPAGPANPLANQINVVQTSQQSGGDAGTRQTDPANERGTSGYQHSTEDDDGGLTRAHEFGHSMGLPDEYHEGPRNPDNTRSIVTDGPPGGLMGHVDPGSKPTPDNWNSLITGNGLH